ncbi:hypothetical protein KR074_009462 [Drosophila pseudoananassae]|nr:hypothetical protein KR074_009462 [Drosophila pseudoananassae]
MLRRCIGRQMQCLLAFPRPSPLIQAASSCQRYTSRASFFGPSFLRGQIKWIENRSTLCALQLDPPMSCDILYTDVNQPGPSFVSKRVGQVQERICLVGQVRGLSDKGPEGPKNTSVCLLSRKGKLYHKESKRDTMETCIDKRKKCLCNKWRPRSRPTQRESHKNISKRLEELMQEGPESSFERKHNESVPKKGHEERPSRPYSDDNVLYFDCEEPKFTLNNFISMLREKSNEIMEQLREGKMADQQRLQQAENDVISKFKDMYEQNSSIARPRRIKDESLMNPSRRSVEDLRTYESQEEPSPNIMRPKFQRFETRKQLELDRLVDYAREKNREAMNNSDGCDGNSMKAQCQAQELVSDRSSKSEGPEVMKKENKYPYHNYQVKYQRYWPKSDTATTSRKQDKTKCYDNDPPQTPTFEVDSSNSGKHKIDIADFNGKLERCEKLQIKIADLVGKCISLVLGKLEKEETGTCPKKTLKEEDHSSRYQRNGNEAIQSLDAVAITKSSQKRIGGKEKPFILQSPETSSPKPRTQAKLYSSQKVNKPPSQYLTLQVDNIIRQCEALKSEFERRSHSTFSKEPGPIAGSREIRRKRSPVEMEMKRRCALEAMRKKCKEGALMEKCSYILEDNNFIEEENEEVGVLRMKQAELKRRLEKAKLKKQCELFRKKIKESEDEYDKGVTDGKFWKEELKKISGKEEQRKKMVEGFLRDKIQKLKNSKLSLTPKQKEPTQFGFTQNTTTKIKEKQDPVKKKCAEKELKKKCAEEDLKKKCSEVKLKKKCAEEELQKKCAEVELKKKCAKEELKKKTIKEKSKEKYSDEGLKKPSAEEELKKKSAEEDLKKKSYKEKSIKKYTDEDLKKKCAADEEERKKVETQLALKCFEAKLKKKCEEIEKRKQNSNHNGTDELKKKNIEASLKKKCPKEEQEKLPQLECGEKKCTEKEFKTKCIQAALKHKMAEKEFKNNRSEKELTKKSAEQEKKEKFAKEGLNNKCTDEEERKKRAEKEFKKKCIQAALKHKSGAEELKKNCAEEDRKKKAERAEEEKKKKLAKDELRKKGLEETHKVKYKVPEQKTKTAALGIRNKDNDFPEIYKESQMQEKRLMGELRRWWEEVDRNTKNVGGVALSEHESEEIKSWLRRQKEKDAQAGNALPKCVRPKEKNMVEFQSLDGMFQTSGLTSEAQSSRGLLDALCDPLPRLRRRVLRQPLIGFPPLIENILGPGYGHGIIQSPERCRIPLLGPNIFIRQILPRLKPLSINGNLRVYWLDGIFPSTTFSRRGHTKDESARYSSLGWPYATIGRTNSDEESQD